MEIKIQTVPILKLAAKTNSDFNKVENAANNDNNINLDKQFVFITGSAGSGKTTLINTKNQEDSNYVELAATTGISAINLNTKTINSLLKYYDTDSLRDSFTDQRLHWILRNIREEKRVLGIEEISMMDANQLDLIYDAINEINEDKNPRKLGLHIIGDLCLAIGTEIMMADGSLKNIEDIKIGDQVMGPDSFPRNVLNLMHGNDIMYRVEQTNGMTYDVNSKHRIALKRSKDGYGSGNRSRYSGFPEKITIETEELADTSRKFRECYVGYKAGTITFTEKDIYIEPYFLGLWLGDGDSDQVRITNADPEVINYCEEYAEFLSMQTSIQEYNKTSAVRVGIVKTIRNKAPNKLLDSFRLHNLINNKHIPANFLFNSEGRRLDLLAGIIDSDGCWSGNRYLITMTNKELLKQVKQLADQLGFRTGFSEKINHACRGGMSYNLTIGGDTWRIPCKVERKKSKQRELKRSRLTSVLTITKLGFGEYAGIEIDGDNLFLLADGTVTHNCQLPPVKANMVTEANCWPVFQQNTIRLNKIWRQGNEKFIEAINLVRKGDGYNAVALLKECGVQFIPQVIDKFDGTTLIGKNDLVDDYNSKRLMEIQGETITSIPSRKGEQLGEWKTHIPNLMRFKVGAYVMILANNCPDFDYVNGDCGTIIAYSKANDSFVIKLKRNNNEVTIKRRTLLNLSRKEPEKYHHTKEFTPYVDQFTKKWVIGTVEYHPMRLAYASTIHKSQGLSLDKLQVNINTWNFGLPGMAYVSISRARTPEGLFIVGSEAMLINKIKTEKSVMQYV